MTTAKATRPKEFIFMVVFRRIAQQLLANKHTGTNYLRKRAFFIVARKTKRKAKGQIRPRRTAERVRLGFETITQVLTWSWDSKHSCGLLADQFRN
jgi:hypothetical protein